MKSFKKFIAEVAQPESEEEKRFKDMHTYEVKPHPAALPHQHTGDIQKPKAKRLADQEGDANYDKQYKNPEKRMVPESTEMDRARYDADDDTKKKKVTLPKAPWEKKEELSAKQKKIDHNKNGKIDGHDLAMIRKKKNEEVELDEISKTKMGQYIKRAHDDKETQKKRANVFDKKGMDADKDKDMYSAWGKADRARKKAANRTKFIGKAVDRITKESIEETTSSALKKAVTQTGPDGKTRTVMKKVKADRTDDRGQDVMGTNESVKLDEAVNFKKGPVRLKDGKQVMVSAQDAKLLNKMFKDLSPANQRQMQKVAMTDKAGFEEIVGFAREAL